MTSMEDTVRNSQINTSNNDEESIFLTSSDDDKDHESIDRDEYLSKEDDFGDDQDDYDDDASDNDDYAFGNSYEEEERSRERRPIKVYDEYDPENIDNNDEDDDDDDSDDDIPLNLYNRNRGLKTKQLSLKEKLEQQKDSDIEEIQPETESSSDDDKREIKQENPQKKRGRPKRVEDSKPVKKAKNTRTKVQPKNDTAKRVTGKKVSRKNSSDSSSVSSVESESKQKQVKKSIPKENVNNETSNKTLVKKQPSTSTSSLQQSNKSKSGESTKLSQAQNIISGRVINFESGFKIPKRPSNETNLDKEPPEKKSKTEEISANSKTVQKEIPKETPKGKAALLEKPNKPTTHSQTSKANLIEKKVEKKPQLVKNGFKESMDFLEALNTSSRKHIHAVKKTPSNPIPTKPIATSTVTTNNSSKIENKSESSQDKLNAETSLNNNIESTSTTCLINRVDSVESQTSTETTSITQNSQYFSDSNLLKLTSNGSKSNLTIPGNKKMTKKKVVWADSCSKQLENVQFFYLDETERVIKKEAYRGADMSKVDKLSEKEFTFRITSGHGFGDYNVEESVNTWPASLIQIELPETTILPEIKSVERDIQAKREATTLALLVFKKFMPDSASEPDPETIQPEAIRTKIIPLDDTNLNSSTLSDSSLLQTEEVSENEKFYNPNQEQKPKMALLSNPVPKTPLLPTPPIQPPSASTEPSGSKTETPSILNLLNLSNLSSSLLKSNEDAERLKKILSLVGAPSNILAETKIEENKPKAGLLESVETRNDLSPNSSNKPTPIPPDTNNNSKWNNNGSSWSKDKYSNTGFNSNSSNNNRNYNNNSGNQNGNFNNSNNNNNNSGRNVFVNNFKRGIGNRPSGDRGSYHRNDNYSNSNNNNNYNNNNFRGSDSRGGGGYNRNNYNNYQNRSRFGENKNYEDGDNKNESKSTQGGRWI